VRTIIGAGRRTIELLKQLYDAGFIHGDVHSGNVAMRSGQLILMDFGFSHFFPEMNPYTRIDLSKTSLTRPLLSPWHLNGSQIGRRDDVFRAIETTADLLGKFYNNMYDGRNGELLQGFKANEKIFTETYNGIGLLILSLNH
jgi:serine/threonine protein kinase